MNSTENIEVNLLLEAIFQKHGYDFRSYSRAHIKRRIAHRLALSGLSNISEMQHKVLFDSDFIQLLLKDLSINVTEMFRDPFFYKILREKVIPVLKTYPFIKIWHAGCSTGEEVYSMSIILNEENLLKRTQIYATDFNQDVLNIANEGIYSQSDIETYNKNFKKSGGKGSLKKYFTTNYESAIIDRKLKENIVFSDHNLVTDGVFGEMNMIVCRNTMIYFNKDLQNKVITLFHNSLVPGGFLCLGSKENLRFTSQQHNFDTLAAKERIFKRKIII